MFVCLGNICRSPTAEGVLLHLAKEQGVEDSIYVESSAIGSWNLGESPDSRSTRHALGRGVTLSGKSKLFKQTDFDQFDYILAADQGIVDHLKSETNVVANKNKVHLFTFCSDRYKDLPVPDPYLGGEEGFKLAYDMIEDSCQSLLNLLFAKR